MPIRRAAVAMKGSGDERMSRLGGEADKFGNRYEGIWTAGQLLELARGELTSLTVEPFGPDGEGVEFVAVRSDGTREFHSVKRQHSLGKWSLAALRKSDGATGRSILGDLFAKLAREPTARCRFVSSVAAFQLEELADRASRCDSQDEFERHLDESQVLRKDFEKHVLDLGGDLPTAMELLRRIRIETVGETMLRESIEQTIGFMIYRPDGQHRPAADVRRALAEFIWNNLGKSVCGQDVWNYLEQQGFHRRDWALDAPVQERLKHINQCYVENIEIDLINGERLERQEVAEIFARLAEHEGPKRILLTAAAGLGKSCVTAQLAARLEEAGTPFLVVRLDRYADAHSSHELGRRMELPQSPPIVLAGVAKGGRCTLLVDQLDAVSAASGRNERLWEAFDELRREVERIPNMGLTVACREFDLQHDPRLRRLARDEARFKQVSLRLLSLEEVDAVLSRAGHGGGNLSPRHKEILRTPLHLMLFVAGSPAEECGFRHVGELYDRFWEKKQRDVAARLGHQNGWTAAMQALCDEMSQRQATTVPAVILDRWSAAIAAMCSERVLIPEERRLRFFHESFLDYAFARLFCARAKTLVALLLEDEQHLFRRSQVRQVLAFLRDHDRPRYLNELRGVLGSAKVRFHIKKLVFQWLGNLSDPQMDEWAILEPHWHDERFHSHVTHQLRNATWFDLLASNRVFESWLTGGGELAIRCVLWICMAGELRRSRLEAMAALFAPHAAKGGDWDDRMRALFSWGDIHNSKAMRGLFLDAIGRGLYDPPKAKQVRSLWSILETTNTQASEFAIDAIAAWLDRRMSLNGNPLIHRDEFDNSAERTITEAASAVPKYYAQMVLRRVLKIVELTADGSTDELASDATWNVKLQHKALRIPELLLESLVDALAGLATDEHGFVHELLAPLKSTKNFTVAYILLRAWTANASIFGECAIELMVTNPALLEFGDRFGSGGDGTAAVSREAISACVPFASNEQRRALELAIGGLSEFSAVAPEYPAYIQWLLLEAFGDGFLTNAGRARLAELRARFPDRNPQVPKSNSMASIVSSPIPAEVSAQLTDDAWLDAMREYASESMDVRHWGKGTAIELSRDLAASAKRNRRRFALLAQRMGDDILPVYFEAISDGICGFYADITTEGREREKQEFEALETELVLSVVRRMDRIPGRPCGRSICNALTKLAERPIPTDVLESIGHYALSDPHPRQQDDERRRPYIEEHAENIDVDGLNSVRGGAARAIGALLFADYGRSESLLPIIEAMTQDPSVSVRSCVLFAILPILNHDRDKAVNLFVDICSGEDLLAASHPYSEFVRHAARTHYQQLRPHLELALKSENEASVKCAARLICLASLVAEDAEADAALVRSGSAAMRAAAAEIYAHNVGDPSVGSVCAAYLGEFFYDDDEAVRKGAAKCFFQLGQSGFDEHSSLIERYIDSPGFASGHDSLLMSLQDATLDSTRLTLRLAEEFMESAGADAGDISTAAFALGTTVGRLVMRIYNNPSTDPATRSKCLDVIDKMEFVGVCGMDKELDAHDR